MDFLINSINQKVLTKSEILESKILESLTKFLHTIVEKDAFKTHFVYKKLVLTFELIMLFFSFRL